MSRSHAAAAVPALCLAALSFLACGKRADPLPPYVKTPQAPSSFEVSQIGGEVEIRVQAPRTTTENRPLPVLELEWMEAPADGPFAKLAKRVLAEEVAPGELRVKRLPLPMAPVRFAVRARSGKSASAFTSPATLKPAPPPLPPTALALTATAEGVELTWVNPAGAEPWPTPSPTPSPSPSPSNSRPPVPTPSSLPTPAPPEAAEPPTPQDVQGGARFASPPSPREPGAAKDKPAGPGGAPAPSPRPSPTPALPSGIRIFRTDGSLRAAREPIQASRWVDPSPKTGDKPCYALSYASSLRPLVTSENTTPVCLDLKDTVPPEPPLRPAADLGEGFVEVSWAASPSPDATLYRVYRISATGEREAVTETAGPLLRIQDRQLAPGPRTYEITAVDRAGNESLPSQPAKIVIPGN